MIVNELEYSTKNLIPHTMYYLNGEFTPSELKGLALSMIDEKINFYKLQHLKQWIGNHMTSSDSFTFKIEDLQNQKNNLIDVVEKAAQAGKNIHVGSNMEFSII